MFKKLNKKIKDIKHTKDNKQKIKKLKKQDPFLALIKECANIIRDSWTAEDSHVFRHGPTRFASESARIFNDIIHTEVTNKAAYNRVVLLVQTEPYATSLVKLTSIIKDKDLYTTVKYYPVEETHVTTKDFTETHRQLEQVILDVGELVPLAKSKVEIETNEKLDEILNFNFYKKKEGK